MPIGFYDQSQVGQSISPNQQVYAKIMGLVPQEGPSEASTALGAPVSATPDTPLDPMAYQRASLIGGQQGDYGGTQKLLMQDLAGLETPKLESGMPTQHMLGKALVGALLARLIGGKRAGGVAAQGILGGVQQGAQMGAQTKNQQAQMDYQRQRDILGTQIKIAGMDAETADNLRKEKLGEVRYQQSRLDKIAADKADFLEKAALSQFTNPGQLEAFMALAPSRGINTKDPDIQKFYETTKAGIARKQSEQTRMAWAKMLLPTSLGKMLDDKLEPLQRQQAARIVTNVLQSDPQAIAALGRDPVAVNLEIEKINHDAGIQTTANRTGTWRLFNLIKDGRLKDATLEAKKIENKYLEPKEKAELLKLQKEAAILTQKEIQAKQESKMSPQQRKMLTDTGYMTRWGATNKDLADAKKDLNEANAMLGYWQGQKARYDDPKFVAPKSTTKEDLQFIADQQIAFYNAKKSAATTDVATRQESLNKINELANQSWNGGINQTGGGFAPVNPVPGAQAGLSGGIPLGPVPPKTQKLLDDARDAIRRGADPKKVQEALKAELAKIK